jgi:hypothetical protein
MAARVIEIEMGEDQRMRRVVSRSNSRVTGKYPSLKKKQMAYWESAIERDAFRRLDADLSVITFQEQPARITYEVDGQRHIHYPDILVRHVSTSDFVEVKSDADADRDDIQERTAIMRKILAPLGFGYRIWPAREIRTQPWLANEIYLLRYGQRPVALITLERIRRLFEQEPIVTWDVLTRSTLPSDGLFVACRLVLDGWLLIDRDLPLSPGTAVRFNFAKGERA